MFLKITKNLIVLQLETLSIVTPVDGLPKRAETFPLFSRFSSTTPAASGQMSEDEDEILTRSTLKRQAQFLVDTKSRRKGLSFRR